ncbi:MAG: formylglycine-generating enzyme family protein [Nitrospinales bacterium]
MPRFSTGKIKPCLLPAMLLGMCLAGPANAFERFAHSHGEKCQTACHQPENIAQARADKFTVSPCKDCHSGKGPSYSPFRSAPKRLFLASNASGGKPAGQPAKKTQRTARQAVAPSTPQPPPGMAFVPAGEFIMGSNDRWDDESPEHIASTGAFFIDIYEVTNRDYKKFVAATGHAPPFHWPNGEIPKDKENHPVVYVNWFDATDYCAWAGKRLPTEQEWEKAARGEEGNIYPWGNIWDVNKSNNPYKHSTGTEPVGSYPEGKSPYGLYDMSGNVWEWVNSYYRPHPGNTIPRPEYGQQNRVLKGGSWFDCLSYGCGLSAPNFNRSFFTPEVRNNSFGFRCAKTATNAPTAKNP